MLGGEEGEGEEGGTRALRKGEIKVIPLDVTSEQQTLLRLNLVLFCTPAVCCQV